MADNFRYDHEDCMLWLDEEFAASLRYDSDQDRWVISGGGVTHDATPDAAEALYSARDFLLDCRRVTRGHADHVQQQLEAMDAALAAQGIPKRAVAQSA